MRPVGYVCWHVDFIVLIRQLLLFMNNVNKFKWRVKEDDFTPRIAYKLLLKMFLSYISFVSSQRHHCNIVGLVSCKFLSHKF